MSIYTKDKGLIEHLNNRRRLTENSVYRHFKGGLYFIEGVARHSETGEEMVIYRSLKTRELFVRPKMMFMDIKETENGYTYRFSKYEIE